MPELIAISIIGAVLVIDTSIAFQFLISQPIIACTITGWFLNDPMLGLEFGLLFQLIWMADIPAGAYIIPAGNMASIISTVVGIKLLNNNQEALSLIILICVVYGLIIAYVGALAVKINRGWNIFFFDEALKSAEKGHLGSISLINFTALFIQFIVLFILIITGIFAGEKLGAVLLEKLPAVWNYYARYIEYGIFGLGTGLTITMYKTTSKKYMLAAIVIGGILVFAL
ncbi:MAG: PTS sugar transporter subunit IIC [Calditrichaceae bacterium]|nr:PTS sugar transporter subunit IIC [Calditrichaceae bacterium]MBN2707443.1 PTS sugar transporter subunit IIC [Calditrichaceae bacterium]RQV94011.1 MAG: hypothetical protein EH224_11245 [Calditrichota bacterium]